MSAETNQSIAHLFPHNSHEKPVPDFIEKAQQLGHRPLPLISQSYFLPDGRIRMIIGTEPNAPLIGAYDLKPHKALPPTHYPLDDSTNQANETSPTTAIDATLTNTPELITYEEIVEKHKSLEPASLQTGFITGSEENRIYAIVAEESNPDLLIGVFSINLKKGIPQDSLINLLPEEPNPYDDGPHV